MCTRNFNSTSFFLQGKHKNRKHSNIDSNNQVINIFTTVVARIKTLTQISKKTNKKQKTNKNKTKTNHGSQNQNKLEKRRK